MVPDSMPTKASILDPPVARRHFRRWINTHATALARAPVRSVFDVVTIHGEAYTLSFLTNELWDRFTEDIPRCAGGFSPEQLDQHFRFHDSAALFRSLGADRMTPDVLSDLVLRTARDAYVVELCSILYAPSSRRKRLRVARRSSSLTKDPTAAPAGRAAPTRRPPDPPPPSPSPAAGRPIPLAIARPIQPPPLDPPSRAPAEASLLRRAADALWRMWGSCPRGA